MLLVRVVPGSLTEGVDGSAAGTDSRTFAKAPPTSRTDVCLTSSVLGGDCTGTRTGTGGGDGVGETDVVVVSDLLGLGLQGAY